MLSLHIAAPAFTTWPELDGNDTTTPSPPTRLMRLVPDLKHHDVTLRNP